MNPVTVGELAADTPPLTADARSAARRRLQNAMDEEGRRPVVTLLPRRTAFRLAVAATVAVAAGGSAVVVAASGGDARPGARPAARSPRMALSAAQVLHNAASRTLTDGSPLPIPRDDQYLYTKTLTIRTPLHGGRPPRTWTDESWLSVDGSKPSLRQELGTVHHDPALGPHEVPSFPTQYAQLQKLPTDPDKLLKWLGYGQDAHVTAVRVDGGSASKAPAFDPDSLVYVNACLLMKGPRVMPPGLQAAAFEALAKLPRVTLDHDGVDALGRHGVAVSYPRMSFSLVFDRTTYAYLGLRQTGSTPKRVDGHWKQTDFFTELTAREQAAVVDRIGQHP